MCYGSILSESLARAAKAHRCQNCQRTIEPGKLYHKQVVIDGRDFIPSKWCETCAAIMDEERDSADGCTMVVPGEGEVRYSAKNIGWKKIRADIKALRERFKKRTGSPS